MNRDYLEKMADAEDAAGSVSVGGLAADTGQVLPMPKEWPPCPNCGAEGKASRGGDDNYDCGSDSRSRSASCRIVELQSLLYAVVMGNRFDTNRVNAALEGYEP